MRINKGVELLLERMKTNPEKFDGSRALRWATLMLRHNVVLSCPENVIQNPRVFTKEVMRRLLTAYDLERKSGAISRAQLLKELLPGLNDLFGKEYAKYSEEIKDKVNER